MMVTRVWRGANLRPHRLERYLASKDPNFETRWNCGLIERDLIARGIFISVRDLACKLRRYIRGYNKDPKSIKWMYQDVSHRIKPDTNSSVTVH